MDYLGRRRPTTRPTRDSAACPPAEGRPGPRSSRSPRRCCPTWDMKNSSHPPTYRTRSRRGRADGSRNVPTIIGTFPRHHSRADRRGGAGGRGFSRILEKHRHREDTRQPCQCQGHRTRSRRGGAVRYPPCWNVSPIGEMWLSPGGPPGRGCLTRRSAWWRKIPIRAPCRQLSPLGTMTDTARNQTKQGG